MRLVLSVRPQCNSAAHSSHWGQMAFLSVSKQVLRPPRVPIHAQLKEARKHLQMGACPSRAHRLGVRLECDKHSQQCSDVETRVGAKEQITLGRR